MGLDMYLYKAKKIGKKKLQEIDGMRREDINTQYDNIQLLNVDDDDAEYDAMIRDILPYCAKIHAPTDYINVEKIRKENNIPDDWVKVFTEINGVGYTYSYVPNRPHLDDERKVVHITHDEMEAKYTVTENTEYYAVRLKEVGYWRKQYDLQDRLHESYEGKIYNCGYHAVNADMYDYIQFFKNADWGGLSKAIKPEDALFYWEWY